MTGYLNAMRRYFAFGGRASRAEFWQFTFVTAAIIVIALVVDGSRGNGPSNEAEPFTGLAVLVHLLPSLAVAVRRLHDTDRSGWFVLINVVPLIGAILLVVWACQAGTPGRNRFGQNPIGDESPEAPATHVTRAGPHDVIGEIERLAQLKASGGLSETEFEVLKARALSRG